MMTNDSFLRRIIAKYSAAEQLVLFGSRAADLAHSESDWDVLVVQQERLHFSPPNTDLVRLSPDHLSSDLWLGSELAGHIAKYGIWLIGNQQWTTSVMRSHHAIQRKADRIVRRISNLQYRWKILQACYREEFAKILRRDIQRCLSLINGEAVAPTKEIDAAWSAHSLDLVIPTLEKISHMDSISREFLEGVVSS